MKNKHRNYSASLFLLFVLSACGGGNDTPDTSSCPRWRVGDSMTYLKTTTVGNVSDTSNEQFVVTEHTQNEITLTASNEIRGYSIDTNGHYSNEVSDNLTFCPPPTIGEKHVGSSWLPGPIEGTGGWVHTIFLVTAVTIKPVSVPVGEFMAKEIILQRTSVYLDTTTPVPEQPDATLTQYYVGGIGNVKEVEVTPTTNTTITYELTAYSYAP